MVSSSKPTVLTQYPRAQKCRPVTRALPKICLWIRTALLPFMNPIANATLYFGGMLKHIWIWSGIKCPSNISIPRWRHKSRITSPTRLRNCPYNFLFRYFGIMTIWYLHYVHQKIMCSQRANALLFCDIRVDLQHITFGS